MTALYILLAAMVVAGLMIGWEFTANRHRATRFDSWGEGLLVYGFLTFLLTFVGLLGLFAVLALEIMWGVVFG